MGGSAAKWGLASRDSDSKIDHGMIVPEILPASSKKLCRQVSRLHASLFARTASVVRNRSDVFDLLDVQAGTLESGDRTFATAAWTFDSDLDVPHAKLGRLFGSLLSGTLTGKRSAFATPFKSTGSSTGPAKGVALGIGDRHSRVVKRRVDVRDAIAHVATDSLFLVGLGHDKGGSVQKRMGWVQLKQTGCD